MTNEREQPEISLGDRFGIDETTPEGDRIKTALLMREFILENYPELVHTDSRVKTFLNYCENAAQRGITTETWREYIKQLEEARENNRIS